MSNWVPSATYRKVVEANRQFYAAVAERYDASETCVNDSQAQAGLESDLDQIVSMLGAPGVPLTALDACGGSGNVALKLLRRGLAVTLTDVSPQLLDLFRRKCAARGFQAQVVCAEIGEFLAGTDQRFHLVTFSSALHHLEDAQAVLRLALERLHPGGLLYTVFDPTLRQAHRWLTRCLLRGEYYAFKALCQSTDVPAAMLRRLRRIAAGASAQGKEGVALDASTAGMLAEYHVERGMDDLALAEALRGSGGDVVWHKRYASARFAPTRSALRLLGDVTDFKLLIRRRGVPP